MSCTRRSRYRTSYSRFTSDRAAQRRAHGPDLENVGGSICACLPFSEMSFVKGLATWQHYMAATKSGSMSGALACRSCAMRAAIPVYIEATWKAFR